MNARTPVTLPSLSAAMDGALVAIADVASALQAVGAGDDYRLIGGVTVLLHVQRLGLDLPLRATGDADIGVPPALLRDAALVEHVEALGYQRVRSNRWERQLPDRRTATVDLLVPAYTSHTRHTVRVGDVVTTEVPGLATALRRPAVMVDAELQLRDGTTRTTTITLPDAYAALVLKARARTVRSEDRDATDLWRCLEIAAADGVTPEFAPADDPDRLRELLYAQLGPGGAALEIVTRDLQDDPATRLRTRILSLIKDVVGSP
jgi:hypothetical protein